MQVFDERGADLLLCTDIVESGLDIPTANTLIVHRADMFGLAQLYQLRGRIGRGKIRAYAYLTLPPGKLLSEAAQKRLEVMQTLDQLGAGFTLASHDLDIRGAGNLLGEEQSGHIREVGIELYQHLLEEAIGTARGGKAEGEADWTPQIALGTPVLIPESYVADLNVRLGLYRRIAALVDRREIESFAAELIDRFGSLPAEVDNLLEIIAIKNLCRQAGVEKVDAGRQGRGHHLPQEYLCQPGGAGCLDRESGGRREAAPGSAPDRHPRLGGMRERVKGIESLLAQLQEIAGADQAAKVSARRLVLDQTRTAGTEAEKSSPSAFFDRLLRLTQAAIDFDAVDFEYGHVAAGLVIFFTQVSSLDFSML